MSTVYRFGPFEVRAEQLELRRDRVVVGIEPKPVELLIELLRHPNELVTKSELMDSVWADRVVTESAIARSVNKLRDALGDDAQSLIQTVHGYGYRLAANVSVTLEPSTFSVPSPSIAVGYTPSLRPQWRLTQPLDERHAVWLAVHQKTGDHRVFKFASSAPQIRGLRREISIHRLLAKGLGPRDDIARLIDYELSVSPYFVELEYCPLGNLAQWCARQGGAAAIPLESRIRIVVELAEALGCAHGLGVLHLDIKPSNVLIWQSPDGSPHARWCDFGSGQLLEADLLSRHGISALDPATVRTHGAAGALGTLNYIAPELLRGETPTTRSDLYALGVMLYQLACGDLRRPISAGWEQNVEDPLLREDIGAAANDNPALRPASAGALARQLRDREQRRVDIANTQARQVDAERLRRRVERERMLRPWRIGIVLTLLAALALSLVQYRDVRRSRDEAREQAVMAQEVKRFLEHDVLALGSPFNAGDQTPQGISIHDAMVRAAKRLDGRFPTQPAVEASIRATIGAALVHDGDDAEAERQLHRAMALGGMTGGTSEVALQAGYSLAFLVAMEERIPDALRLLALTNQAAARLPNLSLETRAQRDAMTGNVYVAAQQFADAVPHEERALLEVRALDPHTESQVAIREMYLAMAYAQTGRLNRATELFRDALHALNVAEPTPGLLTGLIESKYGIALFMNGRDTEARDWLASGYAHMHSARGSDAVAPEALTYLGWLDLRSGRSRDAIRELRQALAQMREPVAGEREQWTRARARAVLGYALSTSGDAHEGLTLMRSALASYESGLGPNAAETHLFRALYLEQAVTTVPVIADFWAQFAQLKVDRLREAAPWCPDWPARLERLRLAAGEPRNPPAAL